MTTQLTPAQHAILVHAHEHTEGKITWFPEYIKGGARQKVIDSLFKRALITYNGLDWFISAEGYEALGVPRKNPLNVKDLDAAIEVATQAKPRTRDNSKQSQVIAMLKRPEGATIAQICQATGWLPHTCRGAMAGALKKKMGLEISSEKQPDADRVYRITNPYHAA